MDDPPFLIDGALVRHFAAVDVSGARQGRGLGFAAGIPLDAVRGVIVAENLVDGSLFAMYCNERWETIAATPHPDAASAMQAAAGALSGSGVAWQAFRPLSDAERREIETTREFLRTLESDFPGG